MRRKVIIIIGIVIAVLLAGGIYYRFTHLRTGGGHTDHKEAGHREEKSETEEGGTHDKHEGGHSVTMSVEVQRKYGVTIAWILKAGSLRLCFMLASMTVRHSRLVQSDGSLDCISSMWVKQPDNDRVIRLS